MKYWDYRETKMHGTFDFPIAFYHVDASHPRYQMPYHWHFEYEIIRILQGSFHLTIDGNSIHAVKNDILFINGGTPHGGIPEECIYECLVFDIKILLSNNKICNKLIQQLIHQELVLHLEQNQVDDLLKNLVDELFFSMNCNTPGYEFKVQGSLYGIIAHLVQLQAYYVNSSTSNASSQQIKRFKDVLTYIEDHYHEAISLEDMAQVADLSPRYFCRFFRKMTQYTPMEYLNYYRIECACEQLVEKPLSITDVALNCGFNDISYFIKSFHKAKGITPKQYKEAARQIIL